MPDKKTKLRPFHETIIDALKRCQLTEEALRLLLLIKETKIPQNHDKIIKAIEELFNSTGCMKYANCSESINEAKASILAQKALILTNKEKHEKKMLRIYIRTYGETIGQQLANDIKAAGDDLTMKRAAVITAEKALNRPLKEGVDHRINSSNPRRTKT